MYNWPSYEFPNNLSIQWSIWVSKLYPVKAPLQLYVTIHAVQIKTHVEEQKKHWNMKIKTKPTISNSMSSLFYVVFVFLPQCVPCFNLHGGFSGGCRSAPPPHFLTKLGPVGTKKKIETRSGSATGFCTTRITSCQQFFNQGVYRVGEL